jgi:two-component sensor histidine kinase
LRVSVPNSVALTVADQGIGFPADFSLEGSKSLGLQIVQLLAKQIDGSLWFHGAPGASLELQFPLQS